MKHKTHSPLALRFDEALQPSNLLVQMTKASENQYRDQLAEQGNRAFGLALAAAKFVMDSGTMTVVFEGGIPAGARLMKSADRILPVLVDGRTNRIIKWGQVASKGRAAAATAANTALIAVEAAHMISGYANAKRLEKVERSVDSLVHAHESELKSRLEAVYRYSKELLHAGSDALTEHDRQELHRQCKDLMELRARWQDDFRHRLSRIDAAKVGGLKSLFSWVRGKSYREEAHRESREEKAAESVNALEIVQLMHFSLMLQMALAGCAGKMEQFRKLTLEDECHAWRSLAAFGRKRAKEIAGQSGAAEFRRFLDALDDLVAFWSPERWAESAHESKTKAADERGRSRRTPKAEAKAKFLPPPKEGWTVEAYAEARGISEQTAWHELRAAADAGKVIERRRSGTIHYAEAD